MTPEQWKEIKELLDKALQLDSIDRRGFLDQVGSEGEERRRELEELIVCAEERWSFLEQLNADDQPMSTDYLPRGESIGSYRLGCFIGSGAMGEVYEAFQEIPARKVALKVIKRGIGSAEVIRRFEAERQALALMNHHNVATIFDAGTTADGRPYFAMEYVAGMPITTYCDENQFTVQQRLQLYLQVCAGVQHAHQKGIIHRDLKPSNILVTKSLGEDPVPKIIDFGIAKATTTTLLGAGTSATIHGLIVGTPLYMSPEQADATNNDIDTRTDVYSLGVLLFELLVGKRPFEPNGGGLAGLAQILEMIRCVQAPKPSAALWGDVEQGRLAASNRAITLSALRRQISRELDWIVLRALEKDRTRRYSSAADLAADITRYMRLEAVSARPPTVIYRVSKFVRRNKMAVAAASIFLMVLSTFLVDRVVQVQRTAMERDKARAVSGFLIGLFEVADPEEARGRAVTVKEILDKGAKQIGYELKEQPEVQATMMSTLGTVYRRLGLLTPARNLLQSALEIRQSRLGEHADTAESLTEIASLLQDSGDYNDAERVCRKALEMKRKLFGRAHPAVATSLANLALILHEQGKYGEADSLNREALVMRSTLLGDEHRDTVQSINNLAITLTEKGEYQEAESLHRKALALRRRTHGEDHPLVASSLSNLAMVLLSRKKDEDAEKMLRDALGIRLKIHGEFHTEVAITLNNLGMVRFRQDDGVAAEQLFRRAMLINRRVLGDEHPDVAMNLNNLAYVFAGRGLLSEAEKMYRESLRLRRKALGNIHPLVGLTLKNLGDVLSKSGRWQAATELYLESYRVYEKATGPNQVSTGSVEARYGAALSAIGRYPEAEQHLLSALRIFENATEKEVDSTRVVLRNIVELYERWQRLEQASLYRQRLNQH